MADTQEAPQTAVPDGNAQEGGLIEAQNALLKLQEPVEETPETEEEQPTEEEESQPEGEDESLEEEPESEELEEGDEDEGDESRAVEGEDLYAVTVNGEEHTIPLDELLKGYSRQSDYTRKTQELSEQRRNMDSAQNQWQSEIQQIQAERQGYMTALQSVMDNSLGAMDQFADVNWEQLKSDNPLEYITKRDEFREAQENVRTIQYRQQEAAQRHQAEMERTHGMVLQEEHGKLVNALPEWGEPAKRQALGGELREYAVSQGYSPQEMEALLDHRHFITLYKAMRFDKASSPSVKQKKVKNKPRVIRAGSPRGKSDESKSKRTKSMKRLRQTGHIDDAAAALEQLLGE